VCVETLQECRNSESREDSKDRSSGRAALFRVSARLKLRVRRGEEMQRSKPLGTKNSSKSGKKTQGSSREHSNRRIGGERRSTPLDFHV
jgi:hypothetical protein